MKIVSLLPSATEIICGLGLRGQLAAVSHECDFPADVHALPVVTKALIPSDITSGEIDTLVRERLKTSAALYALDREVLQEIQPDLIVTQALCDVCAVADEEVRDAVQSLDKTPLVINLEPQCLDDVLQCIQSVGNAAEIPGPTSVYLDSLRTRIHAVEKRSASIPSKQRPEMILLEWIDPPFSAGHWSPELARLAGGKERLGVPGQRSVTTSWDRVMEVDPEVLVIACCGFGVDRTLLDIPILQAQDGWQDLRCVREDRVFVMDGNAYFNRPGPRLVDSLELLAHTLHPSIHPLPSYLRPATQVTAH